MTVSERDRGASWRDLAATDPKGAVVAERLWRLRGAVKALEGEAPGAEERSERGPAVGEAQPLEPSAPIDPATNPVALGVVQRQLTTLPRQHSHDEADCGRRGFGGGALDADAEPWKLLEAEPERRISRRLVAVTALSIVVLGGIGFAVLRRPSGGRAAPAPAPAAAAPVQAEPLAMTGVTTEAPPAKLAGPGAPQTVRDMLAKAADQYGSSTVDTKAQQAAPAVSATPAPAGAAHWAQSGPAATPTPAPTPAVTPANGWARSNLPRSIVASASAPTLAKSSGGSSDRTRAPIVWPASGPITSYFGPDHPLGIDIGIPLGTPLHALAAGRISFVGGDPCCSYGYYVDIDHGNGVMSRYGHMIQPSFLHVGDVVQPGDLIGYSGSTGFSTGPHVHFEIRLNGQVVNPLLVLPTGQ